MPNHGQHVLVYCGLSAAYATPVDEAARRTSSSRHRSPCGTVGVMVRAVSQLHIAGSPRTMAAYSRTGRPPTSRRPLADLDHLTGDLVAEHPGRAQVGVAGAPDPGVGTADRAVAHPDQQVAGSGRGLWGLLDPDIPRRLEAHHSHSSGSSVPAES
jgi:hypothetical protein